METEKQLSTMISNTGVVFFAGTTVSYFLDPQKYSPLVVPFGFVFWMICAIFVVIITQRNQ